MKDYFKKLIKKKTDRISEIRGLIAASNDVNEVRSLTAEAEELQAEVKEAEDKLHESFRLRHLRLRRQDL